MRYSYIIIPLLAIIILLIGRVLTTSCDAMTWYHSLKLPALTPPNWGFALAWNIIFLCASIALIIVWNGFVRNMQFWAMITLFVANAILNMFWIYLFFTKHLIGAALIDAILLALVTITIMTLIASRSIVISMLLLPYSLWALFAIYLNYVIWLTN